MDLDALPFPDFCRALLDEDPKRSARDLAAAWLEVHGEDIPRAQFKRVRDAWAADRKAGRVVPPDDADAHDMPTLDNLNARLREAAIAGDHRACVSLASAIKMLTSMGAGGPADTGEDWSRLTRAEAECLTSLTVKLNGAALDETCLWWVSFVAAARPRAEPPHPAHMPLPDPPGSDK